MAKQTNKLRVLLDALCCIVYADGKIHPLEREELYEILIKARVSWSRDHVNAYIDQFVDRIRNEGLGRLVQSTSEKLSVFNETNWERKFIGILGSLAKADGVVDEREIHIFKQFKTALRQTGAGQSDADVVVKKSSTSPPSAKSAPSNKPETVAAKPQVSKSISADPVPVNSIHQQSMAQSESQVALEWKVGDVILDLYRVLPVNEDGEAFHQGGMGKVYKVHHTGWNMDLAVKAPHAHSFKTEHQRDNFIRECEAWINLGMHPHIASCYYVRTLGGVPRIFAEYIEGGSLKEWTDSGRLYEGDNEKHVLGRMLDIAIQFAWGLHYAHEQGMIHQDVKPHNVMLTQAGEVKVVDFGLTRAKSAGEMLSVSSKNQGQTIVAPHGGGYTPAYCSPEQTEGKKLSRRTDVWSWGVSMLEMFTGQASWESGIVAVQVLENFVEHSGKEEGIPAMPKSVVDLLRKCFQVDEKKRPCTMLAVAEQLAEIYSQSIGEPYSGRWIIGAADTPDALNNRALSLLDLGKPDDAVRLWDKALSHDAHHLASTYNRGLMLWRSGWITDSDLVQQLEALRISHQDRWRDEFLLGKVHMERGDAESAVEILREAVKQARGDKTVGRTLAIAKDGIGKGSRFVRIFEGHSRSISSVCFSPDGRFALSGGFDKLVRLWEITTGKCLRTLEDHTKVISAICFSHDGKFALSGCRDKTLKYWELATGQCLRTFEGHTNGVLSVCFSADSSLALSGSSDNTLKLWEVTTGICKHTFEGHCHGISSVSVSADGLFALSGDYKGTLKVWDITTGHCVRTFAGNTDRWGSACFSHDGKLALLGGGNKTLELWELATNKCIRTLKWKMGTVSSVCFSRDNQFALTGSHDGSVQVWHLATERCMRTFKKNSNNVNRVCFSDDGRYVLSGSAKIMPELWVFNQLTETVGWEFCRIGSTKRILELESEFLSLCQQAGRQLNAGLASKALVSICAARAISGYERSIPAMKLHRSIGEYGRAVNFGGGWLSKTFEGHNHSVSSICFSPNGRFALSASEDKTLKLWELATGRCLRTYKGHTWAAFSTVFSPNGSFILSGSEDKTLKLWDVNADQCVRTFEGNIKSLRVSPNGGFDFSGFDGHTKSVRSVCFSPDGRFALSGGDDSKMNLWDVSTGRCLSTLEEQSQGEFTFLYGPQKMMSVCFSPDGRFALSGSMDNTVKLWEIHTGRHVRTFKGHTQGVWSVCVAPNGRLVLSGSDDKTLKLWDIGSGRCVRTFTGHTDEVFCVCVSPDGRFVISGSRDKTLKLWEVSTGNCVYTFTGHTGFVTTVAISPDGCYMLSGDFERSIRLWQLDWDYDIPEPADWNEEAKAYLEVFLTLHCPVGQDGISRVGKPIWNDDDLKRLLGELRARGYGWLSPRGVRKKLEEMKRNWEGPPAL